ncbi:MAG: type IV secretion system protein [Alphaproteobacteria bacterium]|nr:type IV secretion system protein [Alphaproteobacteria bacterium]
MKRLKNSEEADTSTRKNWYADRYQTAVVQRNILAAVTLVSLLGALATSFGIAQMTPLKSVEPYIIQVEEKTGITRVIDPLTDKDITANDMLKSYFLIKYVKAREGYNVLQLQDDFNLVRLMSDIAVYNDFKKQMNQSNPESPINRLQRIGKRTVKVKSAQFLKSDTAQIRIMITEEMPNQSKTMHMAAMITFEFAKLELSAEDRYINPLGFRVTGYRLDEEIINR